MAKLSFYELADVVADLEAIEALEVQSLVTSSPDDIFLCALGFEPRCLELPGRLAAAGFRTRRAAYFKYGTNLDDNAINLQQLEGHLREISPHVDPIEVDVPDFPSRLRALLDLVICGAPAKPPCITLDLSVAANRLILRCMKVLLEYDICVRIIYSEASTYHPTKEEYDRNPEQWANEDLLGLERGVGDVTPSMDYPGHALDPLPDSLILFACFKGERSKAVISFVDPSLLTTASKKIVWLLGEPHLAENRWRLDAMKKINEIGDEWRQYEVSTFDYKETIRILEALYTEMSDRYRITLSPLGSKMQALGGSLFCYMHPDVRVILSTPKEYNSAQYSEGCRDVWKIDLGALEKLRCCLNRVGTLRIEE